VIPTSAERVYVWTQHEEDEDTRKDTVQTHGGKNGECNCRAVSGSNIKILWRSPGDSEDAAVLEIAFPLGCSGVK
jgi:hypothetical protein